MTISDRISRDELVQMYEFAVNQLTTAQEENKRLREIVQDFKEAFDHDVFEARENGVGAFGIDEGVARGNEILRDLMARIESALNGGNSD
jgi:hypothetical protein